MGKIAWQPERACLGNIGDASLPPGRRQCIPARAVQRSIRLTEEVESARQHLG